MARQPSQALKSLHHTADDLGEDLTHRLAQLSREIEKISAVVQDYSDDHFADARRTAAYTARQVGRQSRYLARQVGHQAQVAGKAVQDNPLPVVAALAVVGVLALAIFNRE